MLKTKTVKIQIRGVLKSRRIITLKTKISTKKKFRMDKILNEKVHKEITKMPMGWSTNQMPEDNNKSLDSGQIGDHQKKKFDSGF